MVEFSQANNLRVNKGYKYGETLECMKPVHLNMVTYLLLWISEKVWTYIESAL